MKLTDLIAQFILQMIEQDGGTTDIQRNELAGRMGCVPSQINYVITSRFTPEQGYVVESRRGGGGYIRIMRIAPSSMVMHVVNSVGVGIDEHSCRIILANLAEDGLVSERNGILIGTAISDRTLKDVSADLRDTVRASIFKQLLLTQA